MCRRCIHRSSRVEFAVKVGNSLSQQRAPCRASRELPAVDRLVALAGRDEAQFKWAVSE